MRALSTNLLPLFFLSVLFSCKAEDCTSLLYDKDVPQDFNSRTYETITVFPGSVIGHCSSRCLDNLECQAVEVCKSGGAEYCRFVKGWDPTFIASDSGETCQQYKVTQNTTCDPLEYYDRTSGQCLIQDLCDFETTTEPSCFLTESTDDIFDWIRRSGTTSSVSTGPNGAKVGTYYKYIETSSPRVTGDYAKLVSNRVFEDKTYCLSMYYHMYGSTTGTLKIQTRTGNDTAVTHWELTGDQGNQWYSIDKLNLPLNNNTEIIVEAARGSNYYSDISVDYIVLWPFACL
ncbi:MAM domain-containing glycosylphosphatidylinositol anchor protein 1-like [Saccostrea echinata]|uniref:MAM domain-containing glycosylphosphatidylinositol anchor protein 1-like n=1 Tax=Saccostrea echinata TaxID=191078 RepID=UPI002A83D7E8|nr:MAM domain-containing glycosylphosphatidylinositol anchor protein 1-like [Saccostrea echinata]